MTKRLLKFEGASCGACKSAQSLLDSIEATVEKIDVGEHPELAAQHDIGGIPTFILLDSANDEIDRMIGYNPNRSAELLNLVNQLKEN